MSTALSSNRLEWRIHISKGYRSVDWILSIWADRLMEVAWYEVVFETEVEAVLGSSRPESRGHPREEHPLNVRRITTQKESWSAQHPEDLVGLSFSHYVFLYLFACVLFLSKILQKYLTTLNLSSIKVVHILNTLWILKANFMWGRKVLGAYEGISATVYSQ